MSHTPRQAAGADDTRPRLLIADDDPVVRATLSAELTEFRIVALAKDATEAIELATRHRPDLALVDVDMPGGGGREAVQRISRSSPRTSLVILSVDETRSEVVELLNAGAVAYLRKGSTAAELTLALREALRVKDGAGAMLERALTAALRARTELRGGLPAPAPGTP